MASVQAYTEIFNHLVATHAPVQVIDFDAIENALEQGKDSFIVVEEEVSSENLIAFGDPANLCVREYSVFTIHALVPAPESTGQARLLAERIQTGLRFRILNGVELLDVSPPEPEFMNNGLWTAYGVNAVLKVDRHVAKP